VLARCGGEMTLLQNHDLFAFVDSLINSEVDGGIRYEVAGSLKEGRTVWIVCATGDGLSFRRIDGSEDKQKDYLLAVNHHDGTGALWLLGTRVRAVCQNTVNWALRESDNVYRIEHRSNLDERLDDVRGALRLEHSWRKAMDEEMADFDRQRMRSEEVADFAASVIAGTRSTMDNVLKSMKGKAAENARDQVEAVTYLFRDGKGNLGETKYDAMQGLAEYLDHHRAKYRVAKDAAKAAERRMTDIAFGETVRTKKRAADLLRKW
jgi:phage/plasmid-like protein (TIGR03299 family)